MKKPFGYLLGALLFSLLVACWVEQRIFWDPTALNDDVRNQVYWMARLMDPTLFAQDYIADYFAQPMLVSPVVHGLYAMAWGLGISPLALSQALPLLLVVVATGFLFLFARRYQDEAFAFWVCFAFNCSIWIFKNLAGGLARGFFYPLFFCLLWAITSRRWGWVTGNLWISSLTYPPVFFIGVVLLGIECWAERLPAPEGKARFSALGWSIAGGAVLGIARYVFQTPTQDFGHLTTAVRAEAMRFFYQGGRIELFPFSREPLVFDFPLNLLVDILERLPNLYILIPVVTFLGLLLLYNKTLRSRMGPLLIPPTLWRTLLGSCLLYTVAWLVLFYLYVPERYLQYTLPLVPTFLFGSLIYQLRQHFPDKKKWITLAFVIIGIALPGLFWRPDLMKPQKADIALYNYIQTLPKDTVIAAAPSVASNIPLYSQRSVLISNEAYIAFHQGYFQTMRSRLKDWLQTHYATDWDRVLKYIDQYHADYLVLQPMDFKQNRLESLPDRYYYAFSPAFFQALRQPSPHAYALMNAPGDCLIFQNKKYMVLGTRCLKSHHEALR
jgi:hypothetical protein